MVKGDYLKNESEFPRRKKRLPLIINHDKGMELIWIV